MVRGGKKILRFHPSVGAALKAMYPEFSWDQSQFPETKRVPRNYWSNPIRQRELFDKIGKQLGVKKVTVPRLPFLATRLCATLQYIAPQYTQWH